MGHVYGCQIMILPDPWSGGTELGLGRGPGLFMYS